MIVVITGTCAVGKSTISKLLAKQLDFKIIDVDRERFRRKYPHSFWQTYLSNKACAKKSTAKTIVEGNYIYPGLRCIYGDVYYVHLDAKLLTILRCHRDRAKQHSLAMIVGSWICNKLVRRNRLYTDNLSAEEVANQILKNLSS